MTQRFCLCLVLLATMLALPAYAEPDQGSAVEQERALKLYEKGLELYDQGRYDVALQRFLEVDQIMASPNARLFLGRCYRKLGDLPRAFEAMSAAVEIATKKAEENESYLRTRDAAAAEREQIGVQIGRVTLAVTDLPEGTEIVINSRTIERHELGKQLGVEPGTVTVTATAPDHKPFRRQVEVPAGAVETIAVTLQPEGTLQAAEPNTTLRTAGFVVLGVGVAGMAVFTISGLLANDRYSELEDDCGAGPCTEASYEDSINEGKTRDLVANIGLGVGLAGLVAGTIMVIVGWPEATEGAEESESTVKVDVGPSHAGLTYQLSF